ncbi:hypothetical protein ACFL1Y_00360 [Patescibacteria group bacterium]
MGNKNFIKKILKILVVIILLFWCVLLLSQKIDLTTADLGRHIKNGEMILNGQTDVLTTNFYSYTQPDFKFVNHHWLSGVIFYLINLNPSAGEAGTGFVGLSFFYLLIFLLTFLIFFDLARRKSNFWIASIFSFLLIPLIADRAEIRPEIFTYLLTGIFLFSLSRVSHPKDDEPRDPVASNKNKIYIFLLPLLMLLWINLHIGFIFGLFIIGLFFLQELIKHFQNKKNNFKQILLILILSCLIILINPHGLNGVLQPLTIFNEYGYQIVENKSINFLENYGLQDPNYLLVKLAIIILILSFILLFIFNRKKISLIYLILGLVFSFLAYIAIRNFSHFGLIILPILTFNFYHIYKSLIKKFDKDNIKLIFLILAILAIAGVFLNHYDYLKLKSKNWGFGLRENNNLSIDFFKQNKLTGPVFNNYDIGGYLIYHLYPQEKVFVDNRPEAYSVNFLQNKYILVQSNEKIWQELDEKYNFNIIFFQRHDLTQWAQIFLIERVQDKEWIPVFVDNYTIIFVKDNFQNAEVIEKHKISNEVFF